MDHLIKAIDDLPDEEIIKLNEAIDDLVKVGEQRVYAANTGRYMARCFVKCSSHFLDSVATKAKCAPAFAGVLNKMASEGIPALTILASPGEASEPTLEKLASSDHYYQNGGRAFARIVDLIFNGV
jgi:hypothetical protein